MCRRQTRTPPAREGANPLAPLRHATPRICGNRGSGEKSEKESERYWIDQMLLEKLRLGFSRTIHICYVPNIAL